MARIAMIKAEGEAFYHVVSRIANKAFLLDKKKAMCYSARCFFSNGRKVMLCICGVNENVQVFVHYRS